MTTQPPNHGRRRRLLRHFLSISAMLVAAWLLASLVFTYRMTRRAAPVYAEPAPALSWGQVESLRLRTTDGEELGAWFVPARPRSSGSLPAVVLLHGDGGNRQACLPQAELLAEVGCPVLLVTARAHGDSTGTFNDFGYGARHDVVAAVTWLEQKLPGRPVVVWGQSLGAAAAVFAEGELGGRVRGLILECPYRDLRTAARNRLELALPPPLDTIAYTGLLVVSPLILGDVDKFSPVTAAARIPEDVPVLILAGGADRHARPEEAGAIFQRLESHAELVFLEGAGHMGLLHTDPVRYKQAVTEFVQRCRPAAQRHAGG
jgi:alpha-beta hydrolase superfamily lysophospholipase